jgi:putative PIN family toxin of toxin-antitoxin system
LDTNVLVSAFLEPRGKPARILRKVLSGELNLLLDERVFVEYEGVLSRSKFKLPEKPRQEVLEQLLREADFVSADPVTASLPDPDDLPLLEIAVSGKAEALVTGNKRHYPPDRRYGVSVLSPAEFLDLLDRKARKNEEDEP